MNDLYKNILNKNTGQQFYTGVVSTLSPFTVKLYPNDTAIPVVPTSNLHGITTSSKLILAKIYNQFFAVGIVQDNPYPVGWINYVIQETVLSKTNNTYEDSNLTFSVPKNGIYKMEAFLVLDQSSESPDCKVKYTSSNVTQLSGRLVSGAGSSATGSAFNFDSMARVHRNHGDSITYGLFNSGYLYVNEVSRFSTDSSDGTITLQFAQDSTDAGNPSYLRGESWMKLMKIANN